MGESLIRVPRPAAYESLGLLFARREGVPRALTLRVRLTVEGVPVREISDYLWLVDRLYGRTDPRGLRSYSLRHRARIELAATRQGSLELILQQAIGLADPSHLLLLWIMLRGLPGAGKLISEIVRNYTGAYQDFHSARLARAQRAALDEPDDRQLRRKLSAHVRKLLEEDPELRRLPATRRAEVARYVAAVYAGDDDAVKRLTRFAAENVTAVDLRSED